MDRRTRDAYDRLLPIFRNLSGTLIRFCFRAPSPCDGEPMRTAFHDAVARFGGRDDLGGAYSAHRAKITAPPLTSLSHCDFSQRRRPNHLAQREPYVATPAGDAFALCRRIDRSIRRWAMQHNTRIRSHSRTLVSLLVNDRLGAASRLPSTAFVPGDRRVNNTRRRTGKPLHSRREVHLFEVGGQLEVCRPCISRGAARVRERSSRGWRTTTRERVVSAR